MTTETEFLSKLVDPDSLSIIKEYTKDYKIFGDDVDYPETIKRVVLDILTYFENSQNLDDWEEPATFIDGEFDSNQTKFEKLSNENKICIKSKSKIKGYVLLFFLRMIIDENYDMFFSCYEFEDEDEKEIYTIMELIKIMGKQETDYTEIHLKYKDDIDVWDVKRINKYYETHTLVKHKNKHGVNVIVTTESLGRS